MAETVYEDRREAILQRLFAVMETVAVGFDARRNETKLSDDQKYVVLLDGDERQTGSIPGRRLDNKPPPQKMDMTPEIQFRQPPAKTANVGTDLNKVRINLIAAVMTDSTLLGLTVNRESIVYEGANMVAERGRSMEGGIGVAFTFTYLLRPGQVAA